MQNCTHDLPPVLDTNLFACYDDEDLSSDFGKWHKYILDFIATNAAITDSILPKYLLDDKYAVRMDTRKTGGAQAELSSDVVSHRKPGRIR